MRSIEQNATELERLGMYMGPPKNKVEVQTMQKAEVQETVEEVVGVKGISATEERLTDFLEVAEGVVQEEPKRGRKRRVRKAKEESVEADIEPQGVEGAAQ